MTVIDAKVSANVVEDFVTSLEAQLPIEGAVEREEAQITATLAAECGFNGVAVHAQQRAALPLTRKFVEVKGLAPMSAGEYRVWRLWLRTSYRMTHGEWEGYRFDTVPIAVLELIATLRKHHLFEELEVRTPENMQVDPVLIGWIGNARYLLARWAESDEHLLTYEEIVTALDIGGKRISPGVVVLVPIVLVCLAAGIGVVGGIIAGFIGSSHSLQTTIFVRITEIFGSLFLLLFAFATCRDAWAIRHYRASSPRAYAAAMARS